MGVVYKAEDTKLEREVALKFLAAHLLDDDEAKERFLREAKAAAALHHPNICPVYEIDEDGGKTFLAMAFLEGEALEDRIATGPLPLKDALEIGRQIAEGLSAAHAKGIVHRDIKPANVLVSPEGRATIMDFGLARLTEASKLTRADQTVGTAAYMSPEQIQGSDVDHRADIWAFGCVLYEMVAGVRPFKGQYDQALAYEVVHEEPEPLTGLRAGVPMELEFIVGKCLAKDREDRTGSALEIARELRTLADKLRSGRSTILKTAVQPHLGSEVARPAAPDGSAAAEGVLKRKLRIAWALAAGCLAIAFAAVALLFLSEAPVERPVSRWSFSSSELDTAGQAVAISPNGKHIVFVAGQEEKLWVRDLDRLELRELAGTDGATGPFWSPDSSLIGFDAGGELKKISVQGGPAVALCPLPGVFLGGSWSPDGASVAFSYARRTGRSILEVPALGGQPRSLFASLETEKGSGIASPHFLPSHAGARSVLVRVGSRGEGDIVLKNLETGEWVILAEGEHPVYAPSGHVIYRWQGGLWALPFSLDALKATGEAFPIAETGDQPSVANDGTLISVGVPAAGLEQLVWRDRAGTRIGEIGQPQAGMRFPALSPDGRSVAVESAERDNRDVWVQEVGRPLKGRLTVHEANDGRPQWSPSGREIAFQSERGGNLDIFQRTADGTGEAELLVGTEVVERPFGWSRDGSFLVYMASYDLWYLKRNPNGEGFEALEFLATQFNESAPNLSPDGKFIAFCSNQSGQPQVYVRPFPSGDGQWQISSNGGCQPRWSRDGKEVFYVEGDTLMAVPVTTAPAFEVGVTTPLFSDPYLRVENSHQVSYDVSADGRFVLVDGDDSGDREPPSIHVVQNWYEEFRERGRE